MRLVPPAIAGGSGSHTILLLILNAEVDPPAIAGGTDCDDES